MICKECQEVVVRDIPPRTETGYVHYDAWVERTADHPADPTR